MKIFIYLIDLKLKILNEHLCKCIRLKYKLNLE